MPRSQFAVRIRNAMSARPDAVAIEADGAEVTWTQVRQMMAGIEKALADANIPDGARIGLMGRNLPMHFAALWAMFCSGRCTSMIYAFQPPLALAEDIRTNAWPVILGERRDWSEQAIAAAQEVGTAGFAFTGNAAVPVEKVTLGEARYSGDPLAPGETMLQLLSSGTTGKPKRISLDRVSVDAMTGQTITQYELAGTAEGTVSIMPWPLASLGGSNAALPAAALGQKLVIQERFDAQRMLDLIRKHRPEMISLPPSALGMVLQLEPAKEDLASLRMIHTGSAPLDPDVHARLEDEYGIQVLQFYGATEFAGIICGWTSDDFGRLKEKRGSVGHALPGMQIRIVSPDSGEVLPPGEHGLIQAIVPRIGPDWVSTTDMAMLDEDGFLYLQGRADDAIIRGGFKILPEEVAEVLRKHPKVGDAAVIGVSDPRLGSVPGAVIERSALGEFPSEEELLAFLGDRLPAYKLPARFAFVEKLPRTESMKPQRQGLLALFVDGG